MSASASSSSRRARRRRAPVAATADEPMMDINTTPLIDVMLVLLIMLIITIPVQLDAIHMQLPVGAAPPPQEQQPPPEPLRIDVGADGTVLWNGEALPDTGALDRRLEALAARPVPQDIHLRPDRQAPYAVVAHVLASAQRDGLARLAIVGSEQFAP